MKKESTYNKLKGFFIGVNVSIVVGLATMPTIASHLKEKTSYANNKQLLNNYNTYLNDYIKDFNLENLDDIDVFEKIMQKIRENNTYKKMDDVPYKYERLFLYDNHFGDCSNMADDMTAKFNKINSEYHARNLDVKMESEEDISINRFDRILNKYDIKANHLVTLVDIGDNIILLDPTNDVIGTIKDGRIILFDSDLKMHITPIASYTKNGISGITSLGKDIINSFHNDNVEELYNKFGKSSQENAKQKIK